MMFFLSKKGDHNAHHHLRSVRCVLVAAGDHVAVHGVFGAFARVVAPRRVARVLCGLRQHGHQSVHLRRDERELSARPEAAERAHQRQPHSSTEHAAGQRHMLQQ